MSSVAPSEPPDVTVVVAVYNTMPYLTACLTSLVQQSIGLRRLQVVAVDDGSTDGSGAELDRFAARYPGTFTVVHQANSGGPAVPSNRALELATGRFVFFLGADDFLGTQALRRLVEAADRWEADVVLGRMAGVNSRYVHQAVFAETRSQITLFDSALPYALSNTKLFRRAHIERYGLRYPENMSVCSDQPFTLEACYRAQRISVLADDDYYFAVRRLNAHNITYRSRHDERARCVVILMDFVAELIPEGPRRDAILVRHFAWEVSKLVEDGFLRLDRAVQERVRASVGSLAERYLTAAISRQLPVETRVRLGVARRGTVDDLVAVIRQDADTGVPSTIVDNARWFAAYPGFRDPRTLPDEVFDVTDVAGAWMAKLDTRSVSWESGSDGKVLAVTARSPLPDLASRPSGTVGVVAGELPARVTLAREAGGTVVGARWDVRALVAASAATGQRRGVVAQVHHADGGSGGGEAPVRAPGLTAPVPLLYRQGRRFVVIRAVKDGSGQLMIVVTPVTARRLVGKLRRMLPAKRG